MKTIKQWFETFKDAEIRKRALENLDKDTQRELEVNLNLAVLGGFLFYEAKEGYKFWQAIQEHSNPASVKFDEVKHLIK